jgi:hypothetical protein
MYPVPQSTYELLPDLLVFRSIFKDTGVYVTTLPATGRRTVRKTFAGVRKIYGSTTCVVISPQQGAQARDDSAEVPFTLFLYQFLRHSRRAFPPLPIFPSLCRIRFHSLHKLCPIVA